MLKNIILIEASSVEQTTEMIKECSGVSDRFHFTNGTYAAPAELIVPTTLAGFDFLNKKIASDRDIFAIAVNSDASMQGIMDKKSASQEERDALEDQHTRAMKVAIPLAEYDPSRPVYVVFYDEETPTELYNELAESGLKMCSLHKWGYGTTPDAPRIEGAHNFARVFGFPLPNDKKPLCHDITVGEDQSHFVEVVNLNDYLASEKIAEAKAQIASRSPIPLGFS